MKKDTLTHRMNLANNRLKVPNTKLLTGSLTNKYPVVFDNGRTIIFIDDLSKEAETRERYRQHQNNTGVPKYIKPKGKP